MAMLPALNISTQLPAERQPLPVLKVIYRNSAQFQSHGGASKKTLMALHAAEHSAEGDMGLKIREACRIADIECRRERSSPACGMPRRRRCSTPCSRPCRTTSTSTGSCLPIARTAWSACSARNMPTRCCGSASFCADGRLEAEHKRHKQTDIPIRTVMPKLLDQYKLVGKTPGKRDPGDAAVDELASTIYNGPPASSADAAAAALADGISHEVGRRSHFAGVQHARAPARTGGNHGGPTAIRPAFTRPTPPTPSATWPAITDAKHGVCGLIVAAYHSASHNALQDRRLSARRPPQVDQSDRCGRPARRVRRRGQGTTIRAAPPPRSQSTARRASRVDGVFQTLLKYTISEDGRLHGEKFFHTVGEEYSTTRPAFRWRQITALARVTASAYGYDRQDKHGFHAPGYEEACKLLGVTA